MKKFLLAAMMLVTSSLAFSQIDIPITISRNPYITIGKSLNWNGSGVGNVNNYFIFPLINPDQRYCIFLSNNNATSSHSYTITAWQTGDPLNTTFNNNANGRWAQDTVQGNTGVVLAGATATGYVHASAGARAVIAISGASTQAGTPDTVDVYVVETTADSCGAVQQGVSQSGSNTSKATYSVVSNALLIGANATDVFGICGSPTKLVIVTYASYTSIATASGNVNLFFLKRSTADTGGTTQATTNVKHDSFDITATATTVAYTANPATGTFAGTVRAFTALIPASSPAFASYYTLAFGNGNDKAVILHGANECFYINQGGNPTPAGQAAAMSIEWTEE